MHKYLLTFLAVGGLFTACDTIDEGDRWTEPTLVEMKKNVLVEDFTGQNCRNCPTAANLLHNLSASSMGKHIIAVSIHGGDMSINVKTPNGLANDLGNDYNSHWNVPDWPKGMIDRTDGLGNIGRPCNFTSWTTAIVSQLSKELLVNLDISTNFDAETRQLHVEVTTKATGDYSITNDTKLTVWLTESGIVGQQTMPDGTTNREYVHNHVLRESLSDPYGDVVKGETMNYSFTIPTSYGRNKWVVNPEQMSVVAFVTAPSGEVLQVVDGPVVAQ